MLKQKEQSETGWMKVNEEVCNKPNPRAEEEDIGTRMKRLDTDLILCEIDLCQYPVRLI